MTLSIAPLIGSLFNLAGPDLMIILVFVLFFMGFPIWMVIDCINHESNDGNSKVVWLLVILLAPLGSLIYFFARKLRRPALPPPGQLNR